jgi:hypothetical protein
MMEKEPDVMADCDTPENLSLSLKNFKNICCESQGSAFSVAFSCDADEDSERRAAAEEGPRRPIDNRPEIAAHNERMQALENERPGYKHLHYFIEEFFKRSKAARSCVAPKVFDVDCSCITDVREIDMIMDIFGALQCVYMKAQDEEQKLNPGRPTMAASLELIQKVLELNIQNSKTFGLKTYQPSEIEPIFEEIKSYFNIDVNWELQQNPASYAGPQDYYGLNGCLLSNIMAVLDKVAVIVKNIYLSRAVDRGAVPTDKQRIMEEYRAIFGRITMSLDQYALCARVCGQCPDEDICGDLNFFTIENGNDQESESLTFRLLGNVIEVYTPLLIQEMKAEMKSNKKAAEDKKNRQVMREQRMQKVAAEKVAKEEKEAVVRAEAEVEEKRVAAQKKAAREAEAAEQQRRSREGAERSARQLSAAPPKPDTPEAVAQRAAASAQRKEAEMAEKTRQWQASKKESGPRKKQKKTGNASGT